MTKDPCESPTVTVTPAADAEFRQVLAEPDKAGKAIRVTFAGFS